MTIKALFPTVLPTLNLDFANTKVLDPRVTFTRASTGTFVGSNGLIQTAASGAARFDHNPTTGESLGLLVEEARTNLLLRSEEFDNASWSKAATTVTADSAVSPSGASTADKLIENSATTEHYTRQASPVYTAGATTTMSVYVKAAERASIRIRSLDAAAPVNGFFGSVDTSTGTTSGSNIGTGTFTSVTATSVGNDWWRLSVVGIASATATSSIFDIFLLSGNASSASSYAGNGTSGIFIWGAQLEAGAFATSYIPTTSSTATRAADLASMTGTNFSSWYNQTEGTWFVHHDARQVLLVANNNSFDERQPQMGLSAGLVHDFYSITGGAIQANNIGSTHVMGTPDRAAYALKTNDFIGACNGSLTAADTSGSFGSSITQLNIGAFHNGASVAGGTFRRIVYWPVRLANITLQAITAS